MRTASSPADLAALRSRLGALDIMVAAADAQARNGSGINLDGLDRQVGQLCAAVLDLPDDAGRSLRAELMRLRDTLEALETGLKGGP